MATSESRSGVVLELAEEFLERYRKGERPALKDYIDRYPELAGEIREVFPAMAMMENIAIRDDSLAGGETDAASGVAQPALSYRSSSATTGSSARSATGAWVSSTRPSRSRSAGTWRSRSCPQMVRDRKQHQRFEREAAGRRQAAPYQHRPGLRRR